MSGATELLVLRLGLIVVIFSFAGLVALSLRGSLSSAAAPAGERKRSRNWSLVVLVPGESGFARGSKFSLAGNMLVGRDARAGIVIPDSSVSGRHATVERQAGAWRVVDLGSTNGTFVGGQRVGGGGAVLRPGEKLTIGNVVLQLESD